MFLWCRYSTVNTPVLLKYARKNINTYFYTLSSTCFLYVRFQFRSLQAMFSGIICFSFLLARLRTYVFMDLNSVWQKSSAAILAFLQVVSYHGRFDGWRLLCRRSVGGRSSSRSWFVLIGCSHPLWSQSVCWWWRIWTWGLSRLGVWSRDACSDCCFLALWTSRDSDNRFLYQRLERKEVQSHFK